MFAEAFALADADGADRLTIDAAHMLAMVAPDKDESEKWNREGLRRARISDDPRARDWIGSVTYNMGWDALESGQPAAALPLFEESRDYYIGLGHEDRARVSRWSIGRTLRELGEIDRALELQLQIEAENEAAGSPYGFNLEELGELYLLRGEPEKAKPYFARAWPLLSEVGWLAKSEPERLRRIHEPGGL